MSRKREVFGQIALLTLGVAFAGSCSSSTPASPDAPPAEVTFPQSFMWGSATAAFQIEKGNVHTDWSKWVALGGKIKRGDDPDKGGPDALNHIDDDVRALKDSGQNAYRLSIEWGRIYPTRADFDADTPDADAITAYADLLGKLRAAGITPMVTLNHFALPDWLSEVGHPNDPQGWERPETIDLFTQFCARMAKRFSKDVDWWITINEPLVVVVTGYIQGGSPPGVVLDSTRGFNVARTMARAHARAFDAIHAADQDDADGDGKSAMVSIAAHQRTFHPLDTTDPDDVAVTEHVRYLWNLWFFNAIVRGDWDDDIDGTYDGPNDKKADPSMAHHADFLGINYYSDTLISAHKGVVIPIVRAAVLQDHLPTERAKTDFAWDIYPAGLRTVLLEAKDYALPVVVTENGIADAADKNRGRYIAEHLQQIGWAMKDGVDVRGYYHWSLLDNFEWQEGFCPKFGLYSVDPVSGARTKRASVDVYKSIIAARKVKQSDVDALPPYVNGSFCN
jgi:beta-glucosidase